MMRSLTQNMASRAGMKPVIANSGTAAKGAAAPNVYEQGRYDGEG